MRPKFLWGVVTWCIPALLTTLQLLHICRIIIAVLSVISPTLVLRVWIRLRLVRVFIVTFTEGAFLRKCTGRNIAVFSEGTFLWKYTGRSLNLISRILCLLRYFASFYPFLTWQFCRGETPPLPLPCINCECTCEAVQCSKSLLLYISNRESFSSPRHEGI